MTGLSLAFFLEGKYKIPKETYIIMANFMDPNQE